MKKTKLSILTLLGTAIVASACGNNEKPSPASNAAASGANSGNGDVVELRMTWWGSTQRHERTLKAIELFEKKYPNIKIKAEYSGQDTYWDKLSTQFAGAGEPDIIQFANNYVDYARKGSLLDLAPYIGSEINLDGYEDAFISPGKLDGKLYGINMGGGGVGMIMNLDLIKQANMELPSPDWTWDDMEDYGKQLVANLGSEYTAFADQSKYANYFNYYLRQSGKALYQNDQVGFDQEDVVKWYQMWERFREAKLTPGPEVTAAHAELNVDNSVLTKGKTVMTMSWMNLLAGYDNGMEAEVDLFPLPSGGPGSENGHWLHAGQFMTVSANSKHPKEAALFIGFLISDPEATEAMGTDRGIPGSPAVLERLNAAATPVDAKMNAYYAEVLSKAGPKSPDLPNIGDFEREFIVAAEKVFFGAASHEEAAEAVVKAAQAAVDKSKL
ncbi:ABC transporter substrate-binding protein [Paenibacillaceae bacterium WGS1546]|uniref:ABC transporter substrate-binding protein n=1 Tax=Cohnella sp. WGS1546 TaxID=3366810 RepID=UPI00372D4111